MTLSKYPKRGLSYSQIRDAQKIADSRKKSGIVEKCGNCGGTKFMITTLGIEVCSICFLATGRFIL